MMVESVVWVVEFTMDPRSFLWMAPFVMAMTGIALVWDLRWRRIPNWLTVTALVAAIAGHVATQGATGLVFVAKGFGVGFGVMLVLWLVGGGGGGDVKLMGALGAWLGATGVAIVLVGSVAISIVITLAIIVWRLVAPPKLACAGASSGGQAVISRRALGRILIPFAVPSCVATWAYVALKLFATL